jgi:hypothetical protein
MGLRKEQDVTEQGWAGASEIFNPMAEILAAHVKSGSCKERAAEEIMSLLIGELVVGGWNAGQMQAALAKHQRHVFIRKAFTNHGVLMQEWMKPEPLFADLDFACDLATGITEVLGDGGTLVAKLDLNALKTFVDMATDMVDLQSAKPLKVVG